jgi:hypothetical protein
MDRCRMCEDGVASQVSQLFRENPHPSYVAIGPTIVDDADIPLALALLGECRERPRRRRVADKRDEFARFH